MLIKNDPLVSIIVPVFNRAHLIHETLSSVLLQTYSNWECLIVDDGSTDDVKGEVDKYASKDSRFKFFSRPNDKRKGANSCRNFGVNISKGEFFLFLDSDDLLKDDCLEKRLEIFEKFPDLNFAVFSMGFFKNYEFGNYDYPDLSQVKRDELLCLFLTGPLPWNMTRPFWERSFFLKQEGFNEELDLFDDDEFNIKIVYNKDIRFKIISKTDCYYRIYEENTSKYTNRDFVKKIFRSHLLFLKSLNKLLSLEEKTQFRKEVMLNTLSLMGYLNQENIHRSVFAHNIVFFIINFKSSFRFKIFLLLKFLIAYYPVKMKGGYIINQILNSKIEQAMK
ncbi:glycosyltransferase family 2 protein [Flavobacterium humidisoli]|uniref:Glycosyltransferase family 2 protein n=1 Tax=Flavobacterium humidisoli TaxID=2937442 RepID=A0ABY4LUM1_9FLAO|nr:glycosyltransferase family 2 protein [Flavobacterium humidisoli]UPZ16048.1 glycosyltransferase family 2 protein [Flavobacterium humidisoli]